VDPTSLTWRRGPHKWVSLAGPTVMTPCPCPTGGSSSPDMGPTPLTWRLRPTGVVLLAGPTSLTWPCGAESAASALRFLFGKKTCSLGASNRRPAAVGRDRLPLDHLVGCVVIFFVVLFV